MFNWSLDLALDHQPVCSYNATYKLAHKLVLSSKSIVFKKVSMEVETETEEPPDLMEWLGVGGLPIDFSYSYPDAYKFSMDSYSTITSFSLQPSQCYGPS